MKNADATFKVKRAAFLAAVILLVITIFLLTVYNSIDQSKKTTMGSISSQVSTTDDGKLVVKDLYAGEMTIPKFDTALNTYDTAKFNNDNGLVTYNDDGTFKARGSWDKFGVGETITYTDANPFSVSIATSQVDTTYTVEEMVSMLHIEGTSVDANAIIYSDDVELWVRQNMSGTGTVILPDGTGGVYDRSNIMLKEAVPGPITISNTNGPSLMIAQVTYNADGTFAARSSWSTVSVGNSVTYTSDYPFNIIICTSSKSEYSAEEVLAFVDVRCQG